MILRPAAIRPVYVAMIFSVVINIVCIYYVTLRIPAVYCCREDIREHDGLDFVDMNWKLRYYKSPFLILSAHRALSYGSCFYCVGSRVFLCSKADEKCGNTVFKGKVLVGAPNCELSFECGQDGSSRHVMLKYNDILIDLDALESFR